MSQIEIKLNRCDMLLYNDDQVAGRDREGRSKKKNLNAGKEETRFYF
jgi:hypothetical protein